ncbi:LamG domain-containing protein [Arenibacter algicola]|uniref:LamG domain-containing protein n=1 Tax=Arenibacter algicola TaxID=616991 RepID=UPI001C065D50|nr:LamG domain-containing protein [Arenibacter algicola]MBU2906685.1 LamG domain-containing protein [Arenibacter algicola]
MKRKLNLLFALYCCSVVFHSCEDEVNTAPREISMNCLDTNLETMESLLENATIGDEDGSYPEENAYSLQQEIEKLQFGYSKGLAGQFTLQFEADNYCIQAEKAIAEFKNSLQFTLPPGEPAELIVFGIDGKGRVEFGADPAFGGDDAFSVEAWLKYDKGFFESGIGDFIATFDGSTQPIEGWMINFLGDNLRATIGMGPQESRVLEFGSKFPQNYGEWNHLVMVYDASLAEGQLKMYINGELFFSKTNDIFNGAGELQSYQPNTKNFNMWAFQEPTDRGRTMTGYIKKFRFWNTAKSMEDIQVLMNSDVSGAETDLECAWDFTQVPEDDQNIVDKTGNHTAKIVGSYKWMPLND